jgi:ubiquitin C-terminal hydrolase
MISSNFIPADYVMESIVCKNGNMVGEHFEEEIVYLLCTSF